MTTLRAVDWLGVEEPLLLAPMAGYGSVELAMAVSNAGGLGALACATLTAAQIEAAVATLRASTKPTQPFNLNFFCHHVAPDDPEREHAWQARMARYYRELGVDPNASAPTAERRPFDANVCELVEALRPRVVSFHFGLPSPELLLRVKAIGAIVLSSATTVAEAQWLEANGCDGVIAQGYEAGGHRASFLPPIDVARQAGTFALLPQIVDAVRVPVIAAGGITDARGIVAAFALGASAVQLGTAFLHCPEARLHAAHRALLATASDEATTLTNVFSGAAARGFVNRAVAELGPLAVDAPAFPRAAVALAALRAHAEANGSGAFSPLWAGQAARLGRSLPAAELTRRLMNEAREILSTSGTWLARR